MPRKSLKDIELNKKDLDIEKLEIEIARLKNLVYRDELTGVLNRRGFMEDAGKMFRYIYSKHGLTTNRQSDKLPFSVVFIDIDNFKKINDTYGHDEGDKVLKHTARVMRNILRESDVYARWGGEEFVVALPQANKNTAVRVAEKLCNAFAESEVELGGNIEKVTMSVGIVMHSNETNLEEMIERADQAMYKAKKNGKNQVVTFTHGEEEVGYLLKMFHLVKNINKEKKEKEIIDIPKPKRIPSI